MLSLQKTSKHHRKCTPNVLPCGIKHNGQADVSKRYWNPTYYSDGKQTAYFRGRKLQGKAAQLPEGYRGVVLQTSSSEPAIKATKKDYSKEEDHEFMVEETRAEELAEFDQIMVWDHAQLPDGEMDPYLRGLEEWIGFAETIHSVLEEDIKKA